MEYADKIIACRVYAFQIRIAEINESLAATYMQILYDAVGANHSEEASHIARHRTID